MQDAWIPPAAKAASQKDALGTMAPATSIPPQVVDHARGWAKTGFATVLPLQVFQELPKLLASWWQPYTGQSTYL